MTVDSTPDFKKALLAFVTGALTAPTGVDELTMLALYNLRGSTSDVGLRNDLEAMIRRVELRGGRYFLSGENLSRTLQIPGST